MKLQHTYTESHSDDITALSFHPSPSLPHVLLSGSVDGVLNTYDVRIADEDDAVQSTLQVGASIAGAGWMQLPGQSELKGVWGTTTIETLQLWDADEVSFDTLAPQPPSFEPDPNAMNLSTAKPPQRSRRYSRRRSSTLEIRILDRSALQPRARRCLSPRRYKWVRSVPSPSPVSGFQIRALISSRQPEVTSRS
jgi:WD40 repeat protein